jgi:uncharacterized membrane protein YdjX (TVP38/TMEM64 family)
MKARGGERARAIIRLAIIPSVAAVALLVAWRAGYLDLGRRDQLVAMLQRTGSGGWAAPLYVLAYVAAVVFGLPTTVLSIVGGALFGIGRGLMLAWLGAMAGTIAAHTLARTVGGRPVRRLLGNHSLLQKLGDRADLWSLMRLRVLPLAPFGYLDYAAGLAGVPLRLMLLATAISIVPGMAAYAYAGDRFRAGLEASGAEGRRALLVAGAITVAVSALVLVPWLIGKVKSMRR